MKGMRWASLAGFDPGWIDGQAMHGVHALWTSAFRPLTDVRDAGSRSKAFDVGFPLESGHCAPMSLMSANDPKQTFMVLDTLLNA